MSVSRPNPPAKRLLLVEGVNDKHVVMHLWKRLIKSDPPFCILEKGGIPQLLPSIPVEIDVRRREVLGIVVDADDDVSCRWKAVANRLRRAGIDVPAKLDPAGVVIEGKPHEDAPRVGIWLMPDNASTGELEDFVAKMVPSNDRVWPMSKDYIEEILCADRKFPEGEIRKFSEGKILRAQIYAWLAAREDPRQMGLAIKAEDLDIDGALCGRFTGWLQELFG